MPKLVTRFAPSPTGYIHSGNPRRVLSGTMATRHLPFPEGRFLQRRRAQRMVLVSRYPARAGCSVTRLGFVRLDHIQGYRVECAGLVFGFPARPASMGYFACAIEKPPARMGGGFILKQKRLTIAYRECPLNAGRR